MTTITNSAATLARRLLIAFEAGDEDVVDHVIHPAHVDRARSDRAVGRQAVRGSIRAVREAFRDRRVVVRELFAPDGRIAARAQEQRAMHASKAPIPTGLAGNLTDKPREWWLHWILRVAVASTFIGHGAFGIRGKEAWLEYYAIFGIPAGLGRDLMPLTGAVDIALGVLVLFVPMRSLLLYMAFWGLFTATLRPLAGQGVFELVERSYNFGPALALLLLHGWGHSLREWFSPLRRVPRLSRERARSFAVGFRVIIAAYLIAHGALAVVMKKALLVDLYGSVGVGNAATLNDIIGIFEIGLGALLLWGPVATTPVLLFIVAWKLGTESLYITHGAPGAGWEVIERGGSYAAPLALICLNSIAKRQDDTDAARKTITPSARATALTREATHQADERRVVAPRSAKGTLTT